MDILITPYCNKCTSLCFVSKDGIVIHPINPNCVNSYKRFRFVHSEPEKGRYSHDWLHKQFKSLALEEI